MQGLAGPSGFQRRMEEDDDGMQRASLTVKESNPLAWPFKLRRIVDVCVGSSLGRNSTLSIASAHPARAFLSGRAKI